MTKNRIPTATTHPLDEMNNEIETRGMVVIEDVKKLPAYGEPYISQHLVIVVNHCGISHGEYDMRPVEFRQHDFSVIYPNHPILANDSSDDYRVTLIIISNSLYGQLRHRLTFGNSHIFHRMPKFHLNDEQFNCVCDTIRLLKSVSNMDIERKNEVIASIIDTISLMANDFCNKTEELTSKALTDKIRVRRSVFNQFYECLANHYHESREVKFYAQQLCLSPKYFGTIIKQETGIKAGEWIARYVVICAKTLLRYHTNLNIQQISLQLGFHDPTTFIRYFKNVAGLTPKEYRDNTLKQM